MNRCYLGIRSVDLPRYVVRSELLDIMRGPLPSEYLHTKKKLTSLQRAANPDNSQVYTLHFADGTTVEADLVIGADGIHSPCRAMLQSWLGLAPDRPVFSGKAVYRALIPKEDLSPLAREALLRPDAAAVTHRGPRRHTMSYPIGKGSRLLNLVAYVPDDDFDGSDSWTAKGKVSVLAKELEEFCQPVQDMLRAMEKIGPECFKQALHYRSTLET